MREINRFNTGHYQSSQSSETPPSMVEEAVAQSPDISIADIGVPTSGHGLGEVAVDAGTGTGAGGCAGGVAECTDHDHARDQDRDRAAHAAGSEKIKALYGKTAQDTFAALFDADGNYLYSGVKIEVPKRQAETVVQLLQEKAQTGSLMDSAGTAINNPTQLTDLIQEGAVDYKQALHIAEAGSVNSVCFDSHKGSVTCSCMFGISFVMSLAQAMWSGKAVEVAVKDALKQSFAAGLGSLVLSVTSQQLIRPTLGQVSKAAGSYAAQSLYKSALGKEAISKLTTYALGKSFSGVGLGAGAVGHASKFVRGNVITGIVTTAVMTAPDVYRAAISGNASWKQVGKNLAVNAASVAGGTGGLMAGAAAGAALGSVVPGVGTVIGTAIGAVLGTVTATNAATKVAKTVVDKFARDDADEMMDLCQDAAAHLASEYLLTEDETNCFIIKIKYLVDVQFLRDMFGHSKDDTERTAWAYERFEPLIKDVVRVRKHITLPSDEELAILTLHGLEALEKEDQGKQGKQGQQEVQGEPKVANDEHSHDLNNHAANA